MLTAPIPCGATGSRVGNPTLRRRTARSRRPPRSWSRSRGNLGLVGLGVGTRLTFRGNGELDALSADTTLLPPDHRGTGATSGIAAEDGDAPVSEASFDRGLTWEDPPKRDSRKAKTRVGADTALGRTFEASPNRRAARSSGQQIDPPRPRRSGGTRQEIKGGKSAGQSGSKSEFLDYSHSVPPIA